MRGPKRAARAVAALLAALAITLAAITPALAATQMKTVRTAAFVAQESFFSVDEETGVHSGYAYKFLTDVSDLSGWDCEYVTCGWSEGMDMLLDGRIDVLADVTYTDERAERMLFSAEPMCTESYSLFVSPDSTATQAADLDGHTIAVARGSVEEDMLDDYLAQSGMDCEVVTFDSDAEVSHLLASGEADAFASINFQADSGYVPLARIGQSECYFAISKDRPDLKRDIDEAMAQIATIDPYYTLRLSERYMDNSRLLRTPTQAEREWLAQKGTLRIGYVTGCMPYCSTDADGNVTGVLAGIASTIEKDFSVEVECVPYRDSESLAAALESGAVDAALGLTDNEWVADTNDLSLCDPFLTDSSAVVYSDDFSSCLRGRLAVTRANSFDLPCFRTDFPDADFVVYDTADQCLEAVATHEVDGYVDHSHKVFYAANSSQRYSSLKIAGVSKESGLCFAVQKSNPTLYVILNRLNSCYTDAEVADLLAAYAVPDAETTFADFVASNAIEVVAATVAICAGIVAAVLGVLHRTRALRTLSLTDQLTGLNNRSAYEHRRDQLAEGTRGSLGVAFADVNGLKESNDNRGHRAGDELIRTAAGYLTTCFPHETVYRIGGDEFVVLFPDCDRVPFERSFAQLKDLGGESNGGTLSVGMAWAGEDADIQRLTAEAERQMYEMKREHYSQAPHDRRKARR